MKNKLPKSWCVKNDGSQLFKDTVIKYLNSISPGYSGELTGNFYGIDNSYGETLCNEYSRYYNTTLTLQEFINLTKQDMTKSDLKTGMIVELRRDGEKNLGLVVGDWIQFNNTYSDLNSYNNDLLFTSSCDYDIISVRKPDLRYQIIRKALNKAPIIWKREETVELTMDEIASKFGINVNNLKIKK